MCRSTAAPLMAVAGMAGTAVGVAIAVLREKAERRSIEKEARQLDAAEAEPAACASTTPGNEPEEKRPGSTDDESTDEASAPDTPVDDDETQRGS